MNLLNQQARKDLAIRSVLSDQTLTLIGRSGVDLMHFREGLDVSERLIGADDSDDKVGMAVAEGFEFKGFAQDGSGKLAIQMERLDGLYYPLTTPRHG